jgi:hypothetical protein
LLSQLKRLVAWTSIRKVGNDPRVSEMSAEGLATTGLSLEALPPASVTHTFAKKGKFRVYLFVAQQQQYDGVQYQTYVDVTPG